MLPDDVKKIVDEAKRAFDHKKAKWQPLWDDVFTFIMPERKSVDGKLVPSDFYRQVHDSTGIHAAKSLANTLVTGLVPSWVPWFRLAPGPDVPEDKREELRKQLSIINRIILLYFNRSNFAQEIQPAFLDCVMSTGVLREDPVSTGVKFKNIPLDEVAIGENSYHEVDRVYHRQELMAREILSNEEWASIIRREDESFFESLQEKPDQMIPIWVLVDDSGPKTREIVVLEQNLDIVLEDRPLPSNPYIVFRWSRVPGEPYGAGPAMVQYADVRYLNKIKELASKGMALEVGGVYTGVDDGIFNPYTARLQPAMILPVMSNDINNPTLRRLDTAMNINIAQFAINDLRTDIRRGFYADRFSPAVGEKFTATEVVMRAKLIAQELGATYSLLEKELLRPVVIRLINILVRQGVLDKSVRPDDRTINITFISSLAQAQRLNEVDDLMQFLAMAGQLEQLDPKAGMVPDAVKIMHHIGELMNIDASLLRDAKDVDQIMQQAMQTAMQQGGQDGQQAGGLAALLGGAAPGVGGGTGP